MAAEANNSGKARSWARFGTRLSVIYSAAGAAPGPGVKARVLDLSGAGVRFRAQEKLQAEARLNLKLMFPGEPMPVQGRVVRVLPCPEHGEKCYDVAAVFLDLSEDEREKIDMWFYRERLDAAPESGDKPGAERRRSERYEVKKAYAEVRKKGLFSAGKWQRGIIKQLSRHGVLLMLKFPLAYGDRAEALLHLPAYDEPVRLVARVVRVRSKNANLCLSYSHEIGMEFIKIRRSDLDKLGEDKYFQNLIERADSEYF